MRKGLTFLPSITLAAALTLPSLVSAEPHAESVVATVNGEDITLGHLVLAYDRLPQQYKQLEPEVLFDALLDQLIQQTALQQSVNGGTPHHVELALQNELRSLMAGEAIEKVMQDAASDADIQAAYDTRYADGFGGNEFNASHILVESREEADAIKAELDGGADFSETAKAKSTGPSGPGGGSLGWFGEGRMVPEFEEAVKGLEIGQISDPVQTQFGWHLIILNDKRKQSAPLLDEVRDEITTELQSQAVEQRVNELVDAANIERPAVSGLTPDMLQSLELVRK
ncbi:MAG: peptidylprolyl isomerase [Rhodobacteraceae bacterium]|nr:peptidylprolyl isomerase [Paracoccaceae bacterium]